MKNRNLSTLIESDLESAELILAARGISEDLQDIAEKLAKLQVDKLMPLTDRLKEVMGINKANAFNEVTSSQLVSLLDATKSAKDEIDNQVLILNGEKAPDSEMDMSIEPSNEIDNDEELDFEVDDDFGAAPAASGSKDEPLGRAKKESVQVQGRSVMERKRVLASRIKKLEEKAKTLREKRKCKKK